MRAVQDRRRRVGDGMQQRTDDPDDQAAQQHGQQVTGIRLKEIRPDRDGSAR
jgi:hypothetical protein